jgi:AcrR family transcriptional regulator
MLEVGAELFGELGYERTTVRQIAGKLGLQSGSLYSHIAGKNEILEQIVLRVGDEFIARARAARDASDSPKDALSAMCEAHLGMLNDFDAAVTVYFDEWKRLDTASRQTIVNRRNTYEKLFATVIRDGMSQGQLRPDIDVKYTILVLLSVLNWTYTWYRPDRGDSRRTIVDGYLGVILRGLLNAGDQC